MGSGVPIGRSVGPVQRSNGECARTMEPKTRNIGAMGCNGVTMLRNTWQVRSIRVGASDLGIGLFRFGLASGYGEAREDAV